MKKLALKLSDLRVETFTTAEQTGGRGTVQGHYGTTHTQQGETCRGSCGNTCHYTCDGYVTSPDIANPCVWCGPIG
jgi:hypothetical protein